MGVSPRGRPESRGGKRLFQGGGKSVTTCKSGLSLPGRSGELRKRCEEGRKKRGGRRRSKTQKGGQNRRGRACNSAKEEVPEIKKKTAAERETRKNRRFSSKNPGHSNGRTK